MRANDYAILQRAVEEGVRYGYSRAHKHTETPLPADIRSHIEQAVMNAICEVFNFDHDGQDLT